MDSRIASKVFGDVASLVKNAPLPTYNYCRMRGRRLLASNGVTDIDIPIDMEGEGTAGILFPAHEMAGLCRALARAGEEIRWECDGDRIHVAHAYGDIWLKGLSADQYPAATDLEPLPDPLAELSGDSLLAALRLVEHVLLSRRSARSNELVFAGAFLEIYPDGLSMVAMDGPRLACYQDNPRVNGKPVWAGIIPRNTVSMLIKRMSASSASGSAVIFSGSQVGARFSFSDEHISTRLIDGTYPEWRKIMAIRNDLPATVTSESLIQALEICAIAGPSQSAMPVRLEFSRDRLSISADNEYGTAQQTLPAQYRAGKLSMLIDGALILESVKAISGLSAEESGSVEILHDASPLRALRLLSQDGKAFCGIMPMRGQKKEDPCEN